MHRPIHLEEPETTIMSTTHRGVGELALASGNIQRSLFEFVWPHFTNDYGRLLAGLALGKTRASNLLIRRQRSGVSPCLFNLQSV